MKRGLLLFSLLIFLPFVSASYDGGFNLDKSSVHLGDVFTITASNIQFEGDKYSGNAMIIFSSEEISYTLLTEVLDGSFIYSASFCDSPECILDSSSGEFKITIKLLNLQLESLHKFEEVLTINLVDKLDITLNLEETQLLPGDTIELEGSVYRSIDSVPVNNVELKIIVDGSEDELILNTETFEYSHILSNKIQSNYHDLSITAIDTYGNIGNNTISFYVTPLANWMEVKTLNGSEFNSGDTVLFKIDLFDQADQGMSKEINFELINSKNKKVLDDSLISGQEFEYTLKDYESPGEWKILAEFEDLESEMSFFVLEVKDLDVQVQDSLLIIKNIGNVNYDDNLVLNSDKDGEKLTVSRRTNLVPGEEVELELFSLFSSGRQFLTVVNTGDDFELLIEDPRTFVKKISDFFTEITGQAIMSSGSRTSNLPTYFLIFFFLTALIVFRYRLKNPRHKPINRLKNSKFKFPKFKRKSSSIEVDNLKDRILKDIEDSQKVTEPKSEDSPNSKLVPSIFEKDFSKVEEPKGKPSRVEFDKPFDRK